MTPGRKKKGKFRTDWPETREASYYFCSWVALTQWRTLRKGEKGGIITTDVAPTSQKEGETPSSTGAGNCLRPATRGPKKEGGRFSSPHRRGPLKKRGGLVSASKPGGRRGGLYPSRPQQFPLLAPSPEGGRRPPGCCRRGGKTLRPALGRREISAGESFASHLQRRKKRRGTPIFLGTK